MIFALISLPRRQNLWARLAQIRIQIFLLLVLDVVQFCLQGPAGRLVRKLRFLDYVVRSRLIFLKLPTLSAPDTAPSGLFADKDIRAAQPRSQNFWWWMSDRISNPCSGASWRSNESRSHENLPLIQSIDNSVEMPVRCGLQRKLELPGNLDCGALIKRLHYVDAKRAASVKASTFGVVLINEHVAEDGPVVFAHRGHRVEEGQWHVSIRPVPRLD
jgi:hypothetical protein